MQPLPLLRFDTSDAGASPEAFPSWSLGTSKASIGIEECEILAGQLPRKQLRLVQAWIEIHRDELLADWELAISNENPYKIAPL
ncbi:MAG: hypothetical protein DM484_05215 [Candidatus Methylumidiphilus alinenensis]|uniref:DUF4160 domain-containing protein n=1 Tax=Candidatus Methylumidiphilus alinenensis TaxID=2202197 RepID=A0A2W4TL58_9GAMM|nr:MAG: hypothetical protein DM484_05215 [Candidatus Methylumidiphilus alinenensis]